MHIAVAPGRSEETVEFNRPIFRTEFPGEDFSVVTFAHGRRIDPSRPESRVFVRLRILPAYGVSFVNRGAVSGSRALLAKLWKISGLGEANRRLHSNSPTPLWPLHTRGFSGSGCCLATRSPAQAFGRISSRLHTNASDLVMRNGLPELPAVQGLPRCSPAPLFAASLEVLAGL